MTRFARNRDYFAGALIALIGAGAAAEGARYGIGKLTAMGPGFFPVAVGVGMVVMGVLMAVIPSASSEHAGAPPDLRGALAITSAVVLFVLLAETAGLAPAIFACVFVAALGARATRISEAALLAGAVMVFGVLVFSLGLKLQFPIIRGVI